MDFHSAIKHLHPLAQFAVGETYESLQWYSEGIEKPSEQDLAAAYEQAQAVKAKLAYLKDPEYPSLTEKVDALWDMIYSNDRTKAEALTAKVSSVMDKYSKEQPE